MKKPKWYLKRSKSKDLRKKNDQFYFTLSAPNGEIILCSELYTAKQNAYNGIKSIQANVGAEIKDIT